MHIKKIRRSALAVVVLAAAGVTLAACGSSGSASTATNTAAAKQSASSTAPGAGATPASGRSRFSALRECLQKEGVTLPQRKPGQAGGGVGGFFGGGSSAAGGSNPKLAAALKKCESALKITPGRGRSALRNNPAAKAAYTKFAACMRENGVNLPAPNTSGNGPIFDTKGLSTTSPTFKAAEAKCRVDLGGLFKGRSRAPGAGGPPPGSASSAG
jgi:hypothetical protein